MTYQVTIMVEDLESALQGLRADGLLAKQSSEVPDVVHVYGKNKADLVSAAKKYQKTRGLENIKFDDKYFEGLVESAKVDDQELLSAVKEPEHKEVAIEENKTEADLYKEVHPLDLGGVKHAVDDQELLDKVKEGSDFSVELDPVKPSDEAVKVSEAQTQRGGTGNPGDAEKAAEEAKNQPKPNTKGADVVADAVKISTSGDDSNKANADKK